MNKFVQVIQTRFEHTEGPLFDSRVSRLYAVDILGKLLVAFDERGERVWEQGFPEFVGAVGLTEDPDQLVVGVGLSVYRFTISSRQTSWLATLPGSAEQRINECKVGPDQAFWVGTMDLACRVPSGGLHRVTVDGQVTSKRENITISNGKAWSADGTTFYDIDSAAEPRGIDVFEFDRSTGAITFQRRIESTFADIKPVVAGWPAVLDGMTIDAEDKLWVAIYGAGLVMRICPVTARLLERVELPAPKVTSCCFGDPQGQAGLVYISTTREHLSTAELQQFPDSGSIFCLETSVQSAANHYFPAPSEGSQTA